MPQRGAPSREERLKQRTQLCVKDLVGSLGSDEEAARRVLMKYDANLQRIAEVSVYPDQERSIINVQLQIVVKA